jgi:nitroreductase
MREHRSIRKFTDNPISTEDFETILLASQAAATSSHLQFISILHITDKTKREKLVTLTGGQKYVVDAAEFVVFCADLHRHVEIVPHAKTGFVEHLLIATADAGLMAQNALLAAQSLGMGGVFIGGIRNNPLDVCELLNLPKHVFPLFGLCLGYPDQDPDVKPRLPLSIVVHENEYQPLNKTTLTGYDQTVKAYYEERTGGKVSTSWSDTIETKLTREARPLMKDALAKQGFGVK